MRQWRIIGARGARLLSTAVLGVVILAWAAVDGQAQTTERVTVVMDP